MLYCNKYQSTQWTPRTGLGHYTLELRASVSIQTQQNEKEARAGCCEPFLSLLSVIWKDGNFNQGTRLVPWLNLKDVSP